MGKGQIDATTPLKIGDRIRSVHTGRIGSTVRVHPDGSAAVTWDDGSPQPDGLFGDERLPRRLLDRLDSDTSQKQYRAPLDDAQVSLDRLCALAELMAVEEVAAAFASLDVTRQVALFGLFESIAAHTRAAMTNDAEVLSDE